MGSLPLLHARRREPREAGSARRTTDVEVVVMELAVVDDAVELVARNDASVLTYSISLKF
jgi:hypothetical protein